MLQETWQFVIVDSIINACIPQPLNFTLNQIFVVETFALSE